MQWGYPYRAIAEAAQVSDARIAQIMAYARKADLIQETSTPLLVPLAARHRYPIGDPRRTPR